VFEIWHRMLTFFDVSNIQVSSLARAGVTLIDFCFGKLQQPFILHKSLSASTAQPLRTNLVLVRNRSLLPSQKPGPPIVMIGFHSNGNYNASRTRIMCGLGQPALHGRVAAVRIALLVGRLHMRIDVQLHAV
jgi:hypothetical protein